MPRLPRSAPTPAAVVTYVALGTFALTYALMSWNDALDQARAGEWAWPPDPVVFVQDSVRWSLAVALWCAVAWVDGSRHRWRVPVLSAVVVAGWSVLAWWSDHVAHQVNGWYVPWPGPVPATTYGDPADQYPYETAVVLRPGVVIPLAVVAAVAVTSWLAHRRSRAVPPPAVPTTRRARRTAMTVLVLPVVAAVAAASLLQLPPADEYETDLRRYVDVLVSPTFALALAAGAALLLAGRGRAAWVLVVLVGATAVGPLALGWWAGDADGLLGSAALGTIAITLAACVHPMATWLTRLEEPPPAPLPPSVPERADAHH
ncbi:hypothetical protein [Cellulomonas sp.]|uniref:hypothetical protein n=1 Tax=Cellulomonas sp. TaxID=40001 RepID=UPI001B0A2DB3|nr:hypothetical protein [Cellulomonas sp.]MBO9554147.1 hypothetical protein [Cellulomonas sp.]